ncbi:succinyl-CoA synthetase, alpha subunit [Candidatus Methanoperedens nitroreducens]|uniref:Succinate--CoA ligase [ADP-forming] subunit alpha n=1 Tax=Candidatus Methanoperedens nitratireducens TaxID=1392998 RepID=A0A062VAY9_9EURY|nr:succinate--CoA ligase subunit alpha [Candidatus Methanoperedens nitroreducens]KCZ73683.1 succinyl-CoA synthetase, alpha subunit [Candidatus Methanoperedens nitroreducens]MDJ1422358.1 succinate--CoA ligase subunit alpha [Candidatus Methanoperedens sp.]
MGILIDKDTRLLVQGITGREGSFQTKQMKDFGTNIVAGITPGKGGSEIYGIPVFDSVAQAVDEVDPNASVIFVPPRFTADAIFEAIDSEIELIICITEGVPVHDMMRVCAYLENSSSRLIGPNCPGITTPGESKVGIMPNPIHRPGNIGLVSRSGTLTYEIIDLLSKSGIGQSTSAGIGGDPLTGTSFIDVLRLFEEDPMTHAVVLVGEIGGTAEQDSIDFIKQMSKPVVAYIVGVSAPPGKTMGHAGAIVSMGGGTALEKIQAFERAGIEVGRSPKDIVQKIKTIMSI